MLHLTDASNNSRWDPNSAEVSLHDDQQDFPFYFESQDGNCLSNVSPIIFLKENVPKFPSFSPLSFSIDFCMLVVLKVLFLSSWQRIVDLNFSPWSHRSRKEKKATFTSAVLLWYRSKEGTTWIFTSSPTPTRCCCNFLGPQKDVGEGSCACAAQAGKHLSLDQSRQFNSVDSQTVLISPRFFRLLFISLMEIGGALLSLTLQVRWRLCSKYFFFQILFFTFYCSTCQD